MVECLPITGEAQKENVHASVFFKYIYICACVHLCVYLCACMNLCAPHVCRCAKRPEGIGFSVARAPQRNPGTGVQMVVRGHVGAGKLSWVLHKSGKHS